MTEQIDLNCDLGEIDPSPDLVQDAAFLNSVSSINIACGYHAGDPATMRTLARLAIPKRIAIGAHPGYPDRANFGRQIVPMSRQEIQSMMVEQMQTLSTIVKQEGGRLHHVKPHGALYNLAAVDEDVAEAIAESIASFDASLRLVGLSGSVLLSAGQRHGLRTLSEVFADRHYLSNGKLVPRDRADAMIHEEAFAAARVLKMLREQSVNSVDGVPIPILAETVCVHSDTPNAALIASRLRRSLEASGVAIRSSTH